MSNRLVVLKVLLLFLLFPAPYLLKAQQFADTAGYQSVSEELGFIDYLINSKETEDALFLLKAHSLFMRANSNQVDSIYYLTGWAYYNLKKLDSSTVYLNRVPESFPLYHKSKYYETFGHIYLGQYGSALNKLPKITGTDSLLDELRRFQLCGIFLLQKNYRSFDSIVSMFTYTNFALISEQKNMIGYKEQLQKIKKRSPVVAGLLSAVIPGSGKWYAGYKGQAIAAAIPTTIFAAVAVENYLKSGPRSAGFIISASLFSVFYSGNIWGSVLSVKTYNERRHNEIYSSILLDLHIPLRRIFN